MAFDRSKLQRLFPDTQTAAYYNPLSQIISLSKYDEADFKSIDMSKPDEIDVEMLSLFEHELTHWLDHVSTLWGQRNLVLIYNSLNARSNSDVEEFWRIKHLFTSFSSDDFFDYFTEEYNLEKDPKSPWRYQISCGIRFSEDGKPNHNKPILFLKFNSFNNIPLLRVPISVASILESNAINAEFIVKTSASHAIREPFEKARKLKEVESEWLGLLYDKDLALYTVIAHLTANLNNQTDAVSTYKVAASIGTLILNLPEEIYDRMRLINIGREEWDRRVKEFQIIKDKGFAFYNLLKNLIDQKGQNNYSVKDLLKCSDLPDESELESLIITEMKKNKELLIEGPFKERAQKIIDKGIEVFKVRGIAGDKPDFKENFLKMDVSPALMFGDTYFDDSNFHISEVLEKLKQGIEPTIEEVYFTSEFYNKKFEEFVNACGI